MSSIAPTMTINSFRDETRGKYHPAKYVPAPAIQADKEEDASLLEKGGDTLVQWASKNKKNLLLFGLPAAAYTILIGALLAVLFKPAGECVVPTVESASKNLMQHWELQKMQPLSEDPYSGIPRAELENTWDDLLGDSAFRLTEDSVRAVDRLDDAIELPDGGYIGSLNVFHELKCIKWLHSSLYADHYYPNMTNGRKEQVRMQSEYCLRHLRRAAMCHADQGIVQYNWALEDPTPHVVSEYQCGARNMGEDQQQTQGGDDYKGSGFKPGFYIQTGFALVCLFKGASIKKRISSIINVTAKWGGSRISDAQQALRQKLD